MRKLERENTRLEKELEKPRTSSVAGESTGARSTGAIPLGPTRKLIVFERPSDMAEIATSPGL